MTSLEPPTPEAVTPERVTGASDRSAVSRFRPASIAAGIAGVLAVLLLMLSVIAVWARSAVLDSDRFAATIETTLAEPEVTRALAEVIGTRLLDLIDVTAFIDANLPEQLQPLAPVLDGAARYLTVEAVDEVVSRPETREGIAEVSRLAHSGVVRLLEGGDPIPGVTVDGDEVALNLLPLITRSATQLQERGLLEGVTIPEFAFDGDPAQQRAELSSALGREVPEEFGQLVVYRSDKVAEASQFVQRARDVLTLAKRGITVLVGLTVIAAVASVALAKRRVRALAVLSLGSLAALVLVRVLVGRIVAEIPDLFTNPGAAVGVTTTVTQLTRGLVGGVSTLAVVALAVGAVAMAVSMRNARAGGAADASQAVRALLAERREVVAISAFALAALLVAVGGLGVFQTLAALVLVATGVAVLARTSAAQSPNV